MTTRLRLLAGACALAAGLFAAATAAPPAAPADLPAPAAKKAVEGDVAALLKLLNDGTPDKRAKNTIKATAFLIAAYADKAADEPLKAQALKVAELTAVKAPDWMAVNAEAKKLSAPPAGMAAPKGKAVHEFHKFNLDEAMSTFRVAKVGGLNMEADIKAQMKGVSDVKLVEQIGARTAVLGDFTLAFPPDFDAKKTKKDWDRWAKQMGDTGAALNAEAAKGDKADKKALADGLKRLDASCTDCHNVFRN